jgi:hypothetical protein
MEKLKYFFGDERRESQLVPIGIRNCYVMCVLRPSILTTIFRFWNCFDSIVFCFLFYYRNYQLMYMIHVYLITKVVFRINYTLNHTRVFEDPIFIYI